LTGGATHGDAWLAIIPDFFGQVLRRLLAAWFIAATATATAAPITFAAIGDFGLDNVGTRQVSALVKRWHPLFISTLGDSNDPSGSATTIDRSVASRVRRRGPWLIQTARRSAAVMPLQRRNFLRQRDRWKPRTFHGEAP
jgi:hypothetical protein